MKREKFMIVLLIIGIILIGSAVWLYYQQTADYGERKQTVSNATTELYATTEIKKETTDEVASVIENESSTEELKQETSTAEKKQNKKLPDNYEWDEKRWGEPPQIVYDFAENQEKFDFIVSEVDSLVTEEEGFTTKKSINGLYYNSKHRNIDNKLSDNFKENAIYLFDHTKFYQITKTVGGHWFMYYDQKEDTDKYIYYMAYAPKMTEEEAWDNGYMNVVGDWYFATIWKV